MERLERWTVSGAEQGEVASVCREDLPDALALGG